METTKNKLSPQEQRFLESCSKYLDTKFYYYGSIQRNDYVLGQSDIDIDIFTYNQESMMVKLQHFLHVPKSNFKKIIWKLRKPNKVVYGYKIKYRTDTIKAEFCIYNEKNKDIILEEHNSKSVVPVYCQMALNVLKVLYYKLHLIPGSYYMYLKRKIFSYGMGLNSLEEFVIL